MKYDELIIQAWQIAKHSKLLWLFSLMSIALGFIPSFKPGSISIECVYLLILYASLLLQGFAQFGLIYCADKAIHAETLTLPQIWDRFKALFGRLVLIVIILLILIVIFGFLVLVLIALVSMVFGNFLNGPAEIFITTVIASPFCGGISFFTAYSLIIHNLSVTKSIKHGLSVFFMNWLSFLGLFLMLNAPIYLIYLIAALTLISHQYPMTHGMFIQAISSFPIRLMLNCVDLFLTPISSVAFLLAYLNFISRFEYPALANSLPKPTKRKTTKPKS